MSFSNALPLGSAQPWSASAPQQALEIITTLNLDEQAALAQEPEADLAWADVGTLVMPSGGGIVKALHAMPQGATMTPFKGSRSYNLMDVVAVRVQPAPFDLNFSYPMIWDTAGNGFVLMTGGEDSSILTAAGVQGVGSYYVAAGRHLKAQLVADLAYSSIYAASGGNVPAGLTSPTKFTAAQPLNPGGIALFSDGTGAEASGGAKHFSNFTNAASGRYPNLFKAFGTFAATYGASLVKMTQVPNPLFANVTTGARVTDTIGPSHMLDRFWTMAVASLTLQTTTSPGNLAAATSNAYADAVLALAREGITRDNFVGAKIGPRRFWIAPQLDQHPYVLNNPTTGPGGGPADMWINIAGGEPGKAPRASWAKLACTTKSFTPLFRMYGAGDPRAQSERLCRFEGDLDAGASPGEPSNVQMFFGA